MVVPVTTELGCKNCHGGSWSRDEVMGISAQTALDILERHDRRHKTDHVAQAQSGRPVSCQSCHADPLQDAAGTPEQLSLSAAVHGFHANYLSDLKGAEACHLCHAGGPDSYTASFRGAHAAQSDESCVRCHGTMEDHALSLLRPNDKPQAERLVSSASAPGFRREDIYPRAP